MREPIRVDVLVPCPVCEGAGQLGHQGPGGCLCCGGEGRVTWKRAEALASIRRDLTAKLIEKGWLPEGAAVETP